MASFLPGFVMPLNANVTRTSNLLDSVVVVVRGTGAGDGGDKLNRREEQHVERFVVVDCQETAVLDIEELEKWYGSHE